MEQIETLANGNIRMIIKHSFGRVSNRKRIISKSSVHRGDATQHLLENISNSHKWWEELKRGSCKNVNAMAKKYNVEQSFFYKQLRLVYLSPLILDALLAGELPESISIAQLVNVAQEPIWSRQHELLGIA